MVVDKCWEAYLKKTKGKKCAHFLCHNEDDYCTDEDEVLCIVCGKGTAMEYWACYYCKNDFCAKHIKKHSQLNGRKFDCDD